MKTFQSIFVLSAASLMVATGAFAQNPGGALTNRGIIVDRIKIFSDADLRAKFRDLARSLSPLLGIDPNKVYEGLFTLQGIETNRSNQSFSLTTTPLPKIEDLVKNENVAKTENKTETSNDKSTNTSTTTNQNTGTTSTTTTTPERSATVPSSALANGMLSSPGTVSQNSLDRLSEYTQLFYETTNLQLLLNRAISDTVGSDGQGARVPLILGIPVSVVAQKGLEGAMAEIWVKVTPDFQTDFTSEKKPINVITQIPQERTYNVSTITNDVRSVGLGAVTTLLNLGFSQTRQQERLYLVKTYDTISMSSFNGVKANNAAEFGWQLRPVLGNKNVTPGKRMLMVALSLPPGVAQKLSVQVYTRWYRYDKKSGAVKELIACNDDKPVFEDQIDLNTVSFSPTIDEYTLNPGGSAGAIESQLVGKGFSPDLPFFSSGRRVAVSSSSDNMQSIQLTLTKDDLLRNNFQAGTMFGGLTRLLKPLEPISLLEYQNFKDAKVEAWEMPNDTYQVRVRITGDARFLNNRCIVQIGDYFKGFEEKDRLKFEWNEAKNETVSKPIIVSAKDIATNKAVFLSAPFYSVAIDGDRRSPMNFQEYPIQLGAALQLYQGFAITNIAKTGKGSSPVWGDYTIYTLTGRGLKNLTITTPDLLQQRRDGKSEAPTDPMQLQTLKPRTIEITTKEDNPQDRRGQYFINLFRQLNPAIAAGGSTDVYLIPISNEALQVTQSFVISKEVANYGMPCDVDDGKPCPDTRPFTRVITVDVPKKVDDVDVTWIDNASLNQVGAVKVHGAGLARIKKAMIGKDEIPFVGPEVVDETDRAGNVVTEKGKPKKEKVWYLVLPATLTKYAGPRTVVFTLDDGSVVTKTFQIVTPK